MKRPIICILLCAVLAVGVAVACLTDSEEEGETNAEVSMTADQSVVIIEEEQGAPSVNFDDLLAAFATKEALKAIEMSEETETETEVETETETEQESKLESTVETEIEAEAETEPAPAEEEPVTDSGTTTTTSDYYSEIPLSAELQAVVFDSASTYGVSAALILAMIETESSFDPYAVSSSGCYGLMQLNPSSFGSGLSPAQNIATGTKYIAELINKYGSTHMALVAYNCGESGAQSNYFSQGLYSSSYSRTVVARQSAWLEIVGW